MELVYRLRNEFELLRKQCFHQVELLEQELAAFKLETASKVTWLQNQAEKQICRCRLASQQEVVQAQVANAAFSHHTLEQQQNRQLAQLTETSNHLRDQLLDWQRQCRYYQTEVTHLKQDSQQMLKLLAKHKLKYTPKEPHKQSLDVFDAANLMKQLHELQLEHHRIKEQEQQARLQATGLKLELQETKATLREAKQGESVRHDAQQARIVELEEALAIAENELESNTSSAELKRRQAIVAQAEQRLHTYYTEKLTEARQQERDAGQARQLALKDASKKAVVQHGQELQQLRSKHARLLAQQEEAHRNELAKLNASWKKRVLIAQRSADATMDKDKIAVLVSRQEQLLALAAKTSH
eukprot:m.231613 g.231613  ORF g.231613 m.231613 type:complete len:356 (+) comp17367_c0_seq1:1839-2906(+)